MKIGIVILNWNGLDLLRKYLNEILLNSDNSTIYIIDNNSSDESVLYVRNNYTEVKVISLDKNYGFAEGYNIGLKEVEEEYVCIINNDILVTENWLDPIRKKIKKHPESIIQPAILDINNTEYFEYAGASGGFIDKYGVLMTKDFYDKNDIKKMQFSKKVTENKLTKKSFVESFLSSIKEKMYGSKDF